MTAARRSISDPVPGEPDSGSTDAANDRDWDGAAGITILETLVVLTIIAMIAAVVGPRVVGYLGRAKSDTAALQIDNFENAVHLFYVDTGRYPTSSEGLGVLFQKPAGDPDWNGPYLSSTDALTDPWGRPYIYGDTNGPDGGFDVRSLGRDGLQGGSGEDADISI